MTAPDFKTALFAYLYGQTSVNWPATHTEAIGALVDEHFGAAAEQRAAEVEAKVRALHGGTHWCFGGGDPCDLRDDIVFEPGTEWWPCPTLAALSDPAAPEAEEGDRG